MSARTSSQLHNDQNAAIISTRKSAAFRTKICDSECHPPIQINGGKGLKRGRMESGWGLSAPLMALASPLNESNRRDMNV